MSENIGFSAQAPSLPQGGGAVSGLGETFAPDLSTGSATFSARLDCPNGPNDIGPRLTLQYSTTAGNGPFGLGFNVPLPRLLRSTATGFPAYDKTDSLMLEGVGELLALPDGSLRPQVDAGAWRVVRSASGFRATDREGLYYFLGTQPSGQLSDPTQAARVFAWHLERIEDALGNAVVFTWTRDRAQLYLSKIAYGAYEIRFQYESRPDVVHWSRCGFPVDTTQRCSSVELHMPGETHTLVRRWTLQYTQADPNACSLLAKIVLSGFDGTGTQLDAPPLTLAYSTFAPRDLVRFDDEGVNPGPLSRADRRVELMDWDGNGLPGLLEIAGGGNARFWPNVGNCKWGRPRTVSSLPLFSSPDETVALADMDGDGFADLVRTDGLLAGYVPRVPGEGFARPVSWTQIPSLPATAPNSRMADLNGDGIPDLIVSREQTLELYYRADPDGWSARPQVVSRSVGPDVNLDDPHVSIADMTGDGSPDIVRVDGGGVSYWPYLGLGKWANPVRMSNPPELPFDFRPDRLFVSDVDGDGCADLIYLDRDRVLYWINRSGNSFSPPREIDYVPTGQITLPRIADMRGSGAAGLLWSVAGPLGRDSSYFYLDFCNDSKPYLLTGIDNGTGSRSKISYTTSAREAATDTLRGMPWATTLPVVIPVVASYTTTDAATGRVTASAYHYHEGRYDGVLREFAGFGRVDRDDFGDASIPTLRTTTWFHNGLDPAQPQARMTMDTRRQLRAIRGRLYRQDRFGMDGSALQSLPYDRVEQQWVVESTATAAGPVDIPKLTRTVRSTFERTGSAVATLITVNSAWDSNFNVTDSTETSAAGVDAGQTKSLRTLTQYAHGPAGRFSSRVWRVQQFDGMGLKIGDSISEYDHASEGTLGPQALVTRKTALVMSDALATEVYGVNQPDFAALGYFRRAGEDGWWINQAQYQRTDDSQGLRGEVTGPLGAKTTFQFDANKTFPVRATDPRGNTINAEYDYRASRLQRLTDASGAEYRVSFDALARPTAAVDPLDSAVAPTVVYTYATDRLPVEAGLHRRAITGQTQTIDCRELYDGSGQLLERRVRDKAGEIIEACYLYNARGLQAKVFLERRPPATTYAVPGDSLFHVVYFYDALARPLRQVNADGSVRTLRYGPLLVEEFDEEDNRKGGSHANTSTRKRIDPTGRIRAIEQNLGGRTVASSYGYDVKGNIVSHTDANNVTVRSWYDFMGRLIRVDRPEQSTRSVFDAAGNAVEARSSDATLVVRQFDACNRPVAVRYSSSANPPMIQITYHDQGAPAPADAGAHTIGGRVVRIDDEGGTTIFDYDERGRVALKRSKPTGYPRSLDLNFSYRSDGQLASIVYPDNGSGRRTISYDYDLRGNISAVPGVIDAMEYDLAGSRTRLAAANGVSQTFGYDPATKRLSVIGIDGAAGTLRSTGYVWDLVGNLISIGSPNPKLTSNFVFDDLYRLTAASTGSGRSWTYAYDDAGNITHKSDLGEYRYGENGAPATCLTSAGTGKFSYTKLGEVRESPWGTHTFNPMGRLTRIVGPGGAGQMDFVYDYAGTRVSAKSSGGAAPAVDTLTPDPLYAIESGVLVVNVFDGRGVAARLRDGAQPLYLHTDHLGGLALVTDQSGKVFDELIYDPYGAVLEQTAGAGLPIGFTGGAPDAWSGLLYLQARYYHPALGRFISPDPIVQNVYDPLSWSPYLYCGDNPVTFVDPSGRGFWAIFLAAVAIVALVVLSICTFGATSGLLVVGIGIIAGGIVGGVSAAQHGGSTEDIVSGIFVGAAVGGWAAFAGVYAGGAAASGLGLGVHSFGGAVVAGGINGAINGAAIGFAAGYAGGKGSLDDVWKQTLEGAIVGLVTGAVLGGVAHELSDGPAKSPWEQAKKSLAEKPPPAAGASVPPGSIQSATDPTMINNLPGAAQKVGTGLATKFGAPFAGAAARYALTGPLATAIVTLTVDAAAGTWDLGYIPNLLRKLGLRI